MENDGAAAKKRLEALRKKAPGQKLPPEESKELFSTDEATEKKECERAVEAMHSFEKVLRGYNSKLDKYKAKQE